MKDFYNNIISVSKFKTINNKLYYIHKSVFLNLVYSKVGDAHEHYRRHYLDSWAAEFRNYKAPAMMNSDEAFHADLEKKLKKEDQLDRIENKLDKLLKKEKRKI